MSGIDPATHACWQRAYAAIRTGLKAEISKAKVEQLSRNYYVTAMLAGISVK